MLKNEGTPSIYKSKMKKIAYFILGLVTLCVVSCKESKKSEHVFIADDPRKDVNMQRTQEDTLAVLDLANKFLTALKENDLKGALDQLIEVDSGEVKPMSDERKRELAQGLGMFPVESYSIDEIIMFSDTDTEVRYTTKMFPDSVESKIPGTNKGALHAFRIDNEWHLTILPVKYDIQAQVQEPEPEPEQEPEPKQIEDQK